jgi:hypothetical protein
MIDNKLLAVYVAINKAFDDRYTYLSCEFAKEFGEKFLIECEQRKEELQFLRKNINEIFFESTITHIEYPVSIKQGVK